MGERNVPISDEVVEVMSKELAKDDSDDRGEVQESDGLCAETIAAFGGGDGEEDGAGDIDADGPHKGQHAGGIGLVTVFC